MKSFKTCNCLCLYQFISKDNDSVLIICLHCFNLLILYIKMKNHSKCAEYVCHSYSCIDVLWESLNHIHNKLKFNLSITEKELTWVLARVTHLHKTLKYIKDKVAEKTLCLIYKLVNDNDDVSEDENNFNSSNLLFSNF